MEPTVSPELSLQVVKTLRKVREAIYSVRSSNNVAFLELVNGDELTL